MQDRICQSTLVSRSPVQLGSRVPCEPILIVERKSLCAHWTAYIRRRVCYQGRVTLGASESVTAIRRLVQTAARYGVQLDEGPTAREPSFSSRVSLARAHELWECAARALGPSLPLAVAAADDDRPCLLSLAAMSCR